MRTLAMVAAVVVSMWVGAHADEAPLEAAARLQVGKHIPDAKLVGSYFKGATEHSEWEVPLESGQCYWFSGTSQGAVKNLALTLRGPKGNKLTDGEADTGQATMAHCAAQSGPYKLQAKIDGTGSYVVGVFARQTQVAPVSTGPDLAPLCDKAATGRAAGAHVVGALFDGEGNAKGPSDRAEYVVKLESGKCYWVVGCGEPEHIQALSVALSGPDGKRVIAAKRSSPAPTASHCATATGMYKIQARVKGGSGRFKVGLYSK